MSTDRVEVDDLFCGDLRCNGCGQASSIVLGSDIQGQGRGFTVVGITIRVQCQTCGAIGTLAIDDTLGTSESAERIT